VISAEAKAAVNAKLAKAEEFLSMAEIAHELGAFDAATSLAVSAAISASDSIIVASGGVVPSGQDHSQAVTILRRVADQQTSRHLVRALGLKNKAQYDLQRCTQSDADDAIRAADRLLSKSKGFT
jgi:uncharacterized protein (UPF0332 family)